MAVAKRIPIGIMMRPPFWIISQSETAVGCETTGIEFTAERTVSAIGVACRMSESIIFILVLLEDIF